MYYFLCCILSGSFTLLISRFVYFRIIFKSCKHLQILDCKIVNLFPICSSKFYLTSFSESSGRYFMTSSILLGVNIFCYFFRPGFLFWITFFWCLARWKSELSWQISWCSFSFLIFFLPSCISYFSVLRFNIFHCWIQRLIVPNIEINL